MASCSAAATLPNISLSTASASRCQLYSPKTLIQRTHCVFPRLSTSDASRALRFPTVKTGFAFKRGLSSVCFNSAAEEFESDGESEIDQSGIDEGGIDLEFYWEYLKRWDVPWNWQIVSLTSLACGISFVLSGLIIDTQWPVILLIGQSIRTAAILGIMSLLAKYQPLGDDFFRYDWKEPFDREKGWLTWAIFGFVGAAMANGFITLASYLLSGDIPERQSTDALVRLLPFIGSSSISTFCVWVVTSVLSPLLEETFYRGFFMVSLTKWYSTPVAVLISSAVFAFLHSSQFLPIFILGTASGLAYAHTRNLLTPIAMHAISNSLVTLMVLCLRLQGVDLTPILKGK